MHAALVVSRGAMRQPWRPARAVRVVAEGAAAAADVVVETTARERAGTHTVSYLAALAVLGRLIARLVGRRGEALTRALESAPEAQERTLALPTPVRAAEQVQNCEPVLVGGFGLDVITAQEAALKIKEAAYLWSEGMSVEQALHGPPAAYDERRAAITITPALDDGERTAQLRALLAEIGVTSVTCGEVDEDLAFAPVHPLARPLVAVIPLQRLSAELGRLRGTNPDKIRTDAEPWASAMRRIRL
jgi:glucosamine--fructose-6-phosphate aminotransferase (isomerizing)